MCAETMVLSFAKKARRPAAAIPAAEPDVHRVKYVCVASASQYVYHPGVRNNQNKMKRFLYLFTLIAVLVLVMLVGYYLRYRTGSPEATTGVVGSLPSAPNQVNKPQNPAVPVARATPQQGSLLPSSISGKFGLVAQNQAVNFFVDGDNNAIIVQPDGQVVKVVKGEAATLSSAAVTDLISAEFSYDGKKILATFGDPSAPQGSLFDVATKSWQPLQASLQSAAWSGTNYQIAYLKEGAGYKSLTVFDVSKPKSKPQELARLHVQDVGLNWIKPNQIVLTEKSSAEIMSSVWSFDIKLKKLSLLLDGRRGQESIWSRTSNIGLDFVATISKRGGMLSLVDAAGNALTGLRLNTLPSKCLFGSETKNMSQAATSTVGSSSKSVSSNASTTITADILYCAIPRNADKFSGARLPDDYNKRSLFTVDDIYKINPSDGNASPIFNDAGQSVDVSNLKTFNQNLFFVNRFDNKVYALSLK